MRSFSRFAAVTSVSLFALMTVSASAVPITPYLQRKLEVLSILENPDFSSVLPVNEAILELEHRGANEFILRTANCEYEAQVFVVGNRGPLPRYESKIDACRTEIPSRASRAGGISSGGSPGTPSLIARLKMEAVVNSADVETVLGLSDPIEVISNIQGQSYRVEGQSCRTRATVTAKAGPGRPEFSVSHVSGCE
jgi:hypothetical protein